MSHFYGFIQGHRGEATRMGSIASGFSAWAQTHIARIRVDLFHNQQDEVDVADITFGPGHSTYYNSKRLRINDLSTFIEALDSRDPKIQAIWGKIESEFARLEAEAPKALLRVERKAAAERRRDERERKAKLKSVTEVVKTLEDHERDRLLKVVPVEVSPQGDMDIHMLAGRNLRRENGRVLVDAHPVDNRHYTFTFDCTVGQWVLMFEPEDHGFDQRIELRGFGYRIEEKKEVSA